MPRTPCKLISDADGSEIHLGDRVTTFRGEEVTVTGWEASTRPGSSGRVYVEIPGKGQREYFPGVINAHIVVI